LGATRDRDSLRAATIRIDGPEGARAADRGSTMEDHLMLNSRVVASLVAVAACGMLASGGAQAQALELKLTTGSGPKSTFTTHGHQAFIDAVEKASSGQIKFRMFMGGTLLNYKATLNGLRDQVADVGFIVSAYFPAELKNANLVADLAMLGTSAPVMAAATTEFNLLQCGECGSELQAQGAVDLGTTSNPPYRIISREPVESLDDLKGMKLRAGAGLWNRFLTHFGATPISMAADEIYQAMSAGATDGTIHPPANMKSYAYWDVAKYVTLADLGTFHSMSFIAFSKRTWDKLTTAQRRLMLDNAATAHAGTAVAATAQDEEALAEAKTKGVTVIQPSPAMAKAFRDWAIADLKTVAELNEKKGVTNATAKIAKFNELYEKWSKIITPIEKDPVRIAAAMKREIFDKIDAATHGM